MDPNLALQLMRDAQRERRHDDADAHAADLGGWLSMGGFQPDGMTGAERAYCRRAHREETARGWAAA